MASQAPAAAGIGSVTITGHAISTKHTPHGTIRRTPKGTHARTASDSLHISSRPSRAASEFSWAGVVRRASASGSREERAGSNVHSGSASPRSPPSSMARTGSTSSLTHHRHRFMSAANPGSTHTLLRAKTGPLLPEPIPEMGSNSNSTANDNSSSSSSTTTTTTRPTPPLDRSGSVKNTINLWERRTTMVRRDIDPNTIGPAQFHAAHDGHGKNAPQPRAWRRRSRYSKGKKHKTGGAAGAAAAAAAAGGAAAAGKSPASSPNTTQQQSGSKPSSISATRTATSSSSSNGNPTKQNTTTAAVNRKKTSGVTAAAASKTETSAAGKKAVAAQINSKTQTRATAAAASTDTTSRRKASDIGDPPSMAAAPPPAASGRPSANITAATASATASHSSSRAALGGAGVGGLGALNVLGTRLSARERLAARRRMMQPKAGEQRMSVLDSKEAELPQTFPGLSPVDLFNGMSGFGAMIIIDPRPVQQYRAGHLPRAVNVPVNGKHLVEKPRPTFKQLLATIDRGEQRAAMRRRRAAVVIAGGYRTASERAHALFLAQLVHIEALASSVVMLDGGFDAFMDRFPFVPCGYSEAEVAMKRHVHRPPFPWYPNEILGHSDDGRGWMYLGNHVDAGNAKHLEQLKIQRVLNVSSDVENIFPGKFNYCRFVLDDVVDADITVHFEDAFTFLDEAHVKKEAILVHCHQGVSRSVTIVLAWLMKSRKWSLKKAYDHVKARRKQAFPNVGFWKQLGQFEKVLRGADKSTLDDCVDMELLQKEADEMAKARRR